VVRRLIFRRYVSGEILNFLTANTTEEPGADLRNKLTRHTNFIDAPDTSSSLYSILEDTLTVRY